MKGEKRKKKRKEKRKEERTKMTKDTPTNKKLNDGKYLEEEEEEINLDPDSDKTITEKKNDKTKKTEVTDSEEQKT